MRRVIERRTTTIVEERIVEDGGCDHPDDPYTEDEITVPVAQIPVRFPPIYRKPPRSVISWFNPDSLPRLPSRAAAKLSLPPTRTFKL